MHTKPHPWSIYRLCRLFAFVLVGLALVMHFVTGYYGDKDWELLYAGMWLKGDALYRDIFPVSPPLIFGLYALPAYLGGITGMADYQWLTLLGMALLIGSIALCTRLIALHPAFADSRRRRVEWALLLCFVLIFRTNPGYFLDREHLFFCLCLPYLLRFMPGVRELPPAPPQRWLIGLLAGVGFCLKPQCFIVWAGVQFLASAREKSLRALLCLENGILYGMAVSYAIIAWLFFPEYFHVVVPMALATYGAVIDTTPVYFYAANALGSLVLTFALFRPRLTSPYRSAIYYWLGLCPFFFAYALAGNNWAYTYYPLSSAALIINGFMLWEFLYLRQERKSRFFTLGACLCLLNFFIRIAITLQFFVTIVHDGCLNYTNCLRDEPLIAQVSNPAGPPLSFGAISMDFDRWTHVARYGGAQWKTRFPQLWMLPEFFASDADFIRAHVWILNYVSGALASDLNRNAPAILFVDDTDFFYSVRRRVDFVKFLSASPAFRDAFAHYRFLRHVNICDGRLQNCRYDVYRRMEE